MERKELEERLDPKHLSTDEMRKEVETQAKQKLPDKDGEKEEDPEADPKAHREYPFDFDWKDGRGKSWKGKFKNKVLNIRERQLVGIMRANLGNNVPVSALDDLTSEINLMVAHMTFSLTKRPEWARDLNVLEDVGLLQAIYMEVMAHEAYFLGYGSIEASG